MVDGHLLAINLADRDLNYRMRSEAEWQSAKLPPLGFWIHPEGRPFSIHHDEEVYYASIFVDGGFLDQVCGQHYELKAQNGVVDQVLAHITQALIATMMDARSYSAEVADRLIRTFVYTLAKRHGQPKPACQRGGIAPAQLRALLAWLEKNLHNPITVRDMASRVGISAAHFSREFKRSMGHTPWDYVVDQRLDRAVRCLEAGIPVSITALRCGFSDQSHLCRLFKQKYGVTPSTFIKVRGGVHPVSMNEAQSLAWTALG
jgi:AraC-like DNA-binding protein